MRGNKRIFHTPCEYSKAGLPPISPQYSDEEEYFIAKNERGVTQMNFFNAKPEIFQTTPNFKAVNLSKLLEFSPDKKEEEEVLVASKKLFVDFD